MMSLPRKNGDCLCIDFVEPMKMSKLKMILDCFSSNTQQQEGDMTTQDKMVIRKKVHDLAIEET